MKLLRISQIIHDLFRPGFNMASVPGFPYTEFTALSSYYDGCLDWYTGTALDANISVEGVEVPKYPLKLNPLPATCLKHAMALLGETRDDARPPILPRLVPGQAESESESTLEAIHKAEETLNLLWWENFGRSILMQNAIVSQYMGGSVLALRYVPWEVKSGWRKLPFRIERIEPQYFYPVPIAGDPFRLSEAWVVKPIHWLTAKQYGIPDADAKVPYYWIEHTTLKDYSIRINDKPVTNPAAGTEWKSDGPNRWGCVPFVYIPHIRDTEYFGESHVPTLAGLIEELNLRLADYGDAVSADSHNFMVMSGVQGDPKVRQISKTLPTVVDLGGSNPFAGTNSTPPSLKEAHQPAASQSMRELVELIQNQYQKDSFTPAITDGEDEGSQRSGETLNLRYWPLLIHIQAERNNWTDGLNWFTAMALKMMLIVGIEGITQLVADLRVRQEWASVLPKDRVALINEIVNRISSNTLSPEHAIEMLGDVENVGKEKELILAWLKELAEVKKSERPEPTFGTRPGQPGQPGQAGTAQRGSVNQSGANQSEKKPETGE